jgi:peroxiredoxin family protein
MKEHGDITSIISFYDSRENLQKNDKYDSTYSKFFENPTSAANTSTNLNKISRPDKTKTFKYNTWEITGEHDGIFEKKKSFKEFNAMSYFSKSSQERETPQVNQVNQVNQVKQNMFKEAIKRNSDIIVNVNSKGEEMKFKRFEQYISMEVRGVKKIYDIFEVFNGAKTVNLEPKQSAFQKVSSFFSRKSKK